MTAISPMISPLSSGDAAGLAAKKDSALDRLRAAATPRDSKELHHLSEEFESLFLGIVLKAMRDTVPKDGLLGGSNAEGIYRSMLDEEYAKTMAAQRNTGLADSIEEFLLRSAVGREVGEGNVKSEGIKAYRAQELRLDTKRGTIENGHDRPGPARPAPALPTDPANPSKTPLVADPSAHSP